MSHRLDMPEDDTIPVDWMVPEDEWEQREADHLTEQLAILDRLDAVRVAKGLPALFTRC